MIEYVVVGKEFDSENMIQKYIDHMGRHIRTDDINQEDLDVYNSYKWYRVINLNTMRFENMPREDANVHAINNKIVISDDCNYYIKKDNDEVEVYNPHNKYNKLLVIGKGANCYIGTDAQERILLLGMADLVDLDAEGKRYRWGASNVNKIYDTSSDNSSIDKLMYTDKSREVQYSNGANLRNLSQYRSSKPQIRKAEEANNKLSLMNCGYSVTDNGDVIVYKPSAVVAFNDSDATRTVGKYLGFARCKNLSFVRLGNGVRTVYRRAFAGCENLQSVNIGSSVRYVCSLAFAECTSLATLTFQKGVRTILPFAFCNCKSLKRVVLPSTLTTLGGGAFFGCSNLEEIVVSTQTLYNSLLEYQSSYKDALRAKIVLKEQ